jgi:hypothetical protein
MKQTLTFDTPAMHPRLVLLLAIVLPGVGQVLNNAPWRGFMMLCFMLVLAVVTYNLAAPGTSLVGQFAGGLFVYAISVMDAYQWARYRWAKRHAV